MSLRLDYVSPLPPVRSGIADYSADLLPELAARCDLRLLQLPEQPVAPELAARWTPWPAESALAGGQGRLPLYQMGNNPYHAAVERLARRFPGVLTLHDLVLHHLLEQQTLGRDDWHGYRDRLHREHGWLGDAVAWPRRWGEHSQAALFQLPVHRTLLRCQRGVLVHSRWAAETIAEQLPEVRVQVVPMGVPLPAAADPAHGLELRRRLGIPEDRPVLGSFGFQTPIKRTEHALAALAQPGMEGVHLLIVGEVSPACDLLARARQAGVAARVHVTGFVGFDEFEQAIAATDLCLNLRYPTAGETSASLLRVLAVGRPAVVSDFAQFAELPDRGVIKVPLGDGEVEQLALRVRQLLADPQRLREMGAAAREHVAREHAPARAAAELVAACEPWAELPPPDRGPRPDVPPEEAFAPTTLTWEALPGELEVGGAEAPWSGGERRRLELRLHNRGRACWLPGEAGPGGVVIELQLLVDDPPRDLLAGRPWLPLPRPLAPGESCRLEVEVRRPPGPARLRVRPHVLGGYGFDALGGPVWQQELP